MSQNNLLLLSIAAMLLFAAPVFGFGGSSADCNGDGNDDIQCSGSICSASDHGVFETPGYCECVTWVNGVKRTDRKTCGGEDEIMQASWLGENFGGWPAWAIEVPEVATPEVEQPKAPAPALEQKEV